MRNVLKAGEVFHYFANQVQPSGRCGNTSFALPYAYSYAARIARHIAPGIVAISNQKWSNTTTSHQSDLRQACGNLDCVYVPCVDDVRTSFQAVNISVEKLLKQASTAKSRKDSLLGQALHEIEQFNKFAKILDSDLHIEKPITDDAALKQIAVAVKAENAKRNAAIKERQRQDKLDNDAKLAEWRNGKFIYLPYNLPVALRVNGETIETSKGARIPVNEAPLIWAMVQRKKEWNPGNAIGVYQLTKIREDGSIVVGCHDIAFSELQYVANVLGYTS